MLRQRDWAFRNLLQQTFHARLPQTIIFLFKKKSLRSEDLISTHLNVGQMLRLACNAVKLISVMAEIRPLLFAG